MSFVPPAALNPHCMESKTYLLRRPLRRISEDFDSPSPPASRTVFDRLREFAPYDTKTDKHPPPGTNQCITKPLPGRVPSCLMAMVNFTVQEKDTAPWLSTPFNPQRKIVGVPPQRPPGTLCHIIEEFH